MNPIGNVRRGPRLLPSLLCCVGLTAQGDQDPAQATHEPPTRAAIDAVLRELDVLFAAGDVPGYLARFAPDHPGSHAMLGVHLRHLLSIGASPRRTSRLLDDPRTIGARVVADVEHVVTFDDARLGKDFRVVEQAVVALRATAGARGNDVVPTFAAVLPGPANAGKGRMAKPVGDTFRCPPCNYEVGGARGWICVPTPGDKAQALEGATFYLLGSALACDLSVRVVCDATTPLATATTMAADLRELVPAARASLPVAWCPPAHRDVPVHGVDGAAVELTLDDGQEIRLHVVQFGGLQHLLLTRADTATLQRHAAALRELLGSYRLLVTDCDFVGTTAKTLWHHTGGRLEDGRYGNERHDVSLAGPPGWRAEQRAGGAAFRVVWTSPDGSRLWLVGYTVPRGMERWCRKTAERWLDKLCNDADLDRPARDAGAWQEFAPLAPAHTLLLRCLPKGVGAPGRPHERLLRAVVRDDLLVVLDASAAVAEDRPALQAALDGLQRDR